MLNESDIDKLANLSRLKLTPEEKTGLLSDIQGIVAYVSEIEKAAISSEGVSALPLKNIMREDGEPHEPGLYSEALLAEAPKTEGKYISVKKILA